MLEELDEEIRDHIEIETRDNIGRGMSPEEARYAALRKFGNVTRVKEDTREVLSIVWLEQLFQDVRFGLRMLRNACSCRARRMLHPRPPRDGRRSNGRAETRIGWALIGVDSG